MLQIDRKKNKLRHVAGILALTWMCVIFSFSAQTKEESSEVSGGFSYQIVSSTKILFHLKLDEEQLREIANSIEGFVRKAAHMTEYAILAVLLYVWLGYWEHPVLRKVMIALLITAAYAASDEIHQLYVVGRAGRATDVLIDSAGAILGLVFWILLVKIFTVLHEKKKRKQDPA